jgi:hypothetical protein
MNNSLKRKRNSIANSHDAKRARVDDLNAHSRALLDRTIACEYEADALVQARVENGWKQSQDRARRSLINLSVSHRTCCGVEKIVTYSVYTDMRSKTASA